MSFSIQSPNPDIIYEAGEPVVEESHAGSTSVQWIVDQFTRTGVLEHNAQFAGTYGEFVSGDVYELAQNAIASANSMYESLPEGVRQQFPGGTEQFLEFIQDQNNVEEIKALGLTTDHLEQIETQPIPTPPPAPETPPAAPEAVTEALTDSGNA